MSEKKNAIFLWVGQWWLYEILCYALTTGPPTTVSYLDGGHMSFWQLFLEVEQIFQDDDGN